MERSKWLTRSVGTGEHGVGVGKKEYLVDELGENTVELMKTIKKAIDPLNILNPGKVSDRQLQDRPNIDLRLSAAIPRYLREKQAVGAGSVAQRHYPSTVIYVQHDNPL